MLKHIYTLVTTIALVLTVGATTALAAGGGNIPPQQEWSFKSSSPHWDTEQMFRGYKVATQVCLSCHSFKYIKHRDMMKLGFSEEQVTKLAKELDMGVDDLFISPLSAENAQMAYGTEVPDLSLMNLARPHGADYTAALLTGYNNPPKGFSVPAGKSYNAYFPGNVIAMPPPLTMADQVEYPESGPQASVEQMSRDIAAFIEWTGEPTQIERKNLGVFVLLYLLIFTILSYFLMKRIWLGVKKKK